METSAATAAKPAAKATATQKPAAVKRANADSKFLDIDDISYERMPKKQKTEDDANKKTGSFVSARSLSGNKSIAAMLKPSSTAASKPVPSNDPPKPLPIPPKAELTGFQKAILARSLLQFSHQ